MTIERIQFTDLVNIDKDKGATLQIETAVMAHIHEAQSLPEGEHDLTPDDTPVDASRHIVTVFPDGTGMFSYVDPEADSSADIHERSKFSLRLPEDQPMIAILKDKPEGTRLEGVIFYVPGRPAAREQASRKSGTRRGHLRSV